MKKQDASNINSFRLFELVKKQENPNWLMYFDAILAGQESLVYLKPMYDYFESLPLSSLYASYAVRINAKAQKLRKKRGII